jgi:hypothetical protein
VEIMIEPKEIMVEPGEIMVEPKEIMVEPKEIKIVRQVRIVVVGKKYWVEENEVLEYNSKS